MVLLDIFIDLLVLALIVEFSICTSFVYFVLWKKKFNESFSYWHSNSWNGLFILIEG